MFDIKSALAKLKYRTWTVYFVARDPRTRRWVKLLTFVAAAYAFSPIDFIPDFIPVLGLLDEVLLLFVLYTLIVKMTPVEVREQAEAKAEAKVATAGKQPVSLLGAVIVVLAWITVILVFVWLVMA